MLTILSFRSDCLLDLKKMSLPLKDIIYNVSKLTGMEFAIFDTSSSLISSTELYLKYKGSNVHKASINEVLNEGNVIVNKPGYMKSCIGCRFVNNCPSTIEILSCISLNNISIGVISLTSFSHEKHNLIESHIDEYMETLKNTSNLISMFAQNENNRYRSSLQNTIIDDIIKMNQENILILDRNGIVTNCNDSIDNLFSSCKLYINSIDQILPSNIVSLILSSKTYLKNYVSSKSFSGSIISKPIVFENEIHGFVVRLNPEENMKSITVEEHYLDKIITKDINMETIKTKINKIKDSPSSILITGETGTGKEMVARAIHFSSQRKDKPFIPINCSNIPDNLFESELFGYEEGSFTGAKRGGKIGLFESANEGTIFLDEIGEIPIYLQSKLLRVLQEKSIKRVGSLNLIPIDVRIISATNQDLDEMMLKGEFREDLYYRLKVIPLDLPPLKERLEDLEPLSIYFLNKYNSLLDKKIASISHEALCLFKSYDWPGNIRELENVIEYAVNMEDECTLNIENLPPFMLEKKSNLVSRDRTLIKGQSELILSTLDKYGWTTEGKEIASRELGISVRTLYRRLEKINKN